MLLPAETLPKPGPRPLPSADAGQEIDFGAFGDLGGQVVLVHDAVYGDGHAFLNLAAETRKACVQVPDQTSYARGVRLQLGHAAGVLATGRVGQDDAGQGRTYSSAAACSSTALRTLGGDMGSSVIRMPMASWMAFAIAAMGGTIGTSPTPRAP